MSSLYDGSAASKSAAVFDVLGASDELSSHVGMLVGLVEKAGVDEKSALFLRDVQRNLQRVNSELATPNPEKRARLNNISEMEVADLEAYIDYLESFNDKLTCFILPGVGEPDSQAHICRTVARRMERELCRVECESVHIKCYVNRLSDFFFVLARYICKKMGLTEYKF